MKRSEFSSLIDKYAPHAKPPHRCSVLLALGEWITDDYEVVGEILRWSDTPASESYEPAWRIAGIIEGRWGADVSAGSLRAFRSAMLGSGGCGCTRTEVVAYLQGIVDANNARTAPRSVTQGGAR